MEKIVRQTLLFDFYGELLTEHQQRIYEAVVLNDTGYSEVAADEGISRQGVHDLIRRCDKQLDQYEEKLHLVAKFIKVRDGVSQIRQALSAGNGITAEEAGKLVGIADDILEEL